MSTTTATVTKRVNLGIQVGSAIKNDSKSANLTTVSYSRLLAKEKDEIKSMLTACETDGFWYLDLSEPERNLPDVMGDLSLAFETVAEFFDQDDDVKKRYDVDMIHPQKLNGYTPFRRNAGLSEKSEKGGSEGYTLPLDEISASITARKKMTLPPQFEKRRVFFKKFMDDLHSIGLTILDGLSTEVGNISNSHHTSKASTSCITLQRYPELSAKAFNAGLAAHTDVGSLTILFCADRGLQVLSPHTNEWLNVHPKPGCAVINVGDSLRFISQKRFRSALHRVVPYKDERIINRSSCAYFLRPELDAEFEDEENKRWTSLDWHTRKYKSYREVKNR